MLRSVRKMLLNEKLKKLRKDKNLTQEDLAEKVGVSAKHISAIETGRTKTNIQLLYEIATALNVTVDYFTLGIAKKNDIDEIEEYLRECTDEEMGVVKIFVKALVDSHK